VASVWLAALLISFEQVREILPNLAQARWGSLFDASFPLSVLQETFVPIFWSLQLAENRLSPSMLDNAVLIHMANGIHNAVRRSLWLITPAESSPFGSMAIVGSVLSQAPGSTLNPRQRFQ